MSDPKPAIPINADNIKMDEILPTIFKYGIFIALYLTAFYYILNGTAHYILFIVLMILNFFTVIFFYKDFISVKKLAQALFGDIENTGFTKVFVFLIFITLILNFATIGMVIAVFDYGKQSTNDYSTYTMTPQNSRLINDLEFWYTIYMVFIGAFAFLIVYSYTEGRVKDLLKNIMGIILSLGVVSLSSYICYLSTEFLKTRLDRRQLYQ